MTSCLQQDTPNETSTYRKLWYTSLHLFVFFLNNFDFFICYGCKKVDFLKNAKKPNKNNNNSNNNNNNNNNNITSITSQQNIQ